MSLISQSKSGEDTAPFGENEKNIFKVILQLRTARPDLTDKENDLSTTK